MHGLSEQLIRQITAAAERCGAQKLVLFGSRARGDYHPASDVDLAVYGIKNELPLRSVLEELPTLLKFDVVPVRGETDKLLLKEIERDGVVLLEKRVTKLDQFALALERTREALAEYEHTHSQVVRDGAIQRFEFTCELAWKSCREYLLDEGFTGIDSPKAAMRQAFACSLIDDEQSWLNLLQARNLTSHMYSETQAQEIYEQIEKVFVPLFEKLLLKLKV